MDVNKLPASRQQAFDEGVVQYFTGTPCKAGHLAPRYTSSGQCSTCVNSKAKARAKERGEKFKENRQRRMEQLGGDLPVGG